MTARPAVAPQANSNVASNKTENEHMIVVDFLKIDTSKFSFGKPKENQHGSLEIPIKYDGKTLYMKFPKKRMPFGITKSYEDVKPNSAEYNVYPDNKKLTGMTASISLAKDKESSFTDPYFLKAQEIDEFLIQKCGENSMAWGQAGAPVEAFRGYDQFGFGGKYKRLVKYSYKVDKTTKQRIYTDYPPRIDMSVWANLANTPDPETGKILRSGPITTNLYDKNGTKLEGVTTENVNQFIPKFCEASTLAYLKSLNSSPMGVSCKPRAMQIRAFPNDKLLTDCILNDDDDVNATTAPALVSDDNLNSLNPVAVENYVLQDGEEFEETEDAEVAVHPSVQPPILPAVQQVVYAQAPVQQVVPQSVPQQVPVQSLAGQVQAGQPTIKPRTIVRNKQ